MKKVFVFTLAFLTSAALGSCASGAENSFSLSDGCSLTADIIEEDFEAKADITFRNSRWEAEITEPESIRGMKVKMTEEGYRIEFQELEYTAGTDELPEFSPIRLTFRALEKASAGKLSGTIGGEDYSVKVRKGKPVSADIGSDLKIKFSHFRTK